MSELGSLRRALCGSIAALGLLGVAGSSAWADTFVYSSYSVVGNPSNDQVTIGSTANTPVGGTFEYSPPNYGVGQIDVTGQINGTGSTVTLDTWCIDAFHILAGSATDTIVNSGGLSAPTLTNNGTAYVAGTTAAANVISSQVLAEIAAVAYYGDQNINVLNVSAAAQEAIWILEYGTGPGTSGLGWATFSVNNSAVNSLAATLVSESVGWSSKWLNSIYVSTILADPSGSDNQQLLYLTGAPNGVNEALPLPSTWTMMLIGLAGFGFFAFPRTKRRSAGIAAV
jgi:hypothetical protein